MVREAGKPRGKTSPYGFFVKMCYEEHKKKYPSENVQVTEISKKCSEKWKTMTQQEKQRFYELAQKDRERYQAEVAAFGGEDALRKRKRNKKDPNAPKRALSAFFFFSHAERPEVQKSHPDWKVGQLAQELGRMWKALNDEQKRKYEEMAIKDKARYELVPFQWTLGIFLASCSLCLSFRPIVNVKNSCFLFSYIKFFVNFLFLIVTCFMFCLEDLETALKFLLCHHFTLTLLFVSDDFSNSERYEKLHVLNKRDSSQMKVKRDIDDEFEDGIPLLNETELWVNSTHKTVDHMYYTMHIYKPDANRLKDFWISIPDLIKKNSSVRGKVRHAQLSNSYRKAVVILFDDAIKQHLLYNRKNGCVNDFALFLGNTFIIEWSNVQLRKQEKALNRRMIYEYHRIEVPLEAVQTGAVVEIKANPVCMMFDTCEACMNATLKAFNCSWCPIPSSEGSSFCSDEAGLHRRRQDWRKYKCDLPNPNFYCSSLNETSVDNNRTVLPFEDNVVIASTQSLSTSLPTTAVESQSLLLTTGSSTANAFTTNMAQGQEKIISGTDPAKASGLSSGGVVSLLFIISSIIGLVGWVIYAYYNPHTRSGQFLIRVQ
ncbi:high mobility group protein 1.2 [Trichinella spiralis]|uniref:high mobility group protein 1.2 n=1 Tax=Trichinella spiralis TaxID=6334 RepID=UPI0001EFDB5E|nr:high mobility group protein 1.2 [Trichinella spiralis]